MRSRPTAAMEREVYARAQGRCEYCRIPEVAAFARHQIDHVIAQKHTGPTTTDNLALSCVLCNRRKGSDLSGIDPDTGRVTVLFNPRRDRWDEHFHVEGDWIIGTTAEGRATAHLLQFNVLHRRLERRELTILEAGCSSAEAGPPPWVDGTSG